LAFLGTPAIAVPALESLVEAGHTVGLVVSRPDRRRGRGTATTPSPVKDAARRLGLPVTDRLADVAEAGLDLGVVAAYGRIIPEDVLARLPMVNVHFSLLPRWRGAAPVERAILAGDAVTGVCIMAVEAGLDTGGVYAREEIPIGAEETAAELAGRLASTGASLLIRTLANVREGGPSRLPTAEPQVGDATYAAKIEAADRQLHWSEPAVQLARVVRIGRASTTFRGRRLLVLRAVPVEPATDGGAPGTLRGPVVATGAGGLALREVQPEGARAMAAEEWLRGTRPGDGERLGE
jgi:methionyl-tRNA formyltransferase